jgi:hypothetical protein
LQFGNILLKFCKQRDIVTAHINSCSFVFLTADAAQLIAEVLVYAKKDQEWFEQLPEQCQELIGGRASTSSSESGSDKSDPNSGSSSEDDTNDFTSDNSSTAASESSESASDYSEDEADSTGSESDYMDEEVPLRSNKVC